MTNRAQPQFQAERRVHFFVLGLLGASFLVAGMVAKNERAVFLTPGTGLPAKAFAAMIPADRGGRNTIDRLDTGQPFSRQDLSEVTSGRPAPTTRSGPSGTAPASGLGFADPVRSFETLGSPTTPSAPPGADPRQLASLAPNQFTPSIPQQAAGGGGVTNPGGGAPTGPTTPLDPPTPTAPPTPTSPATPTAPVTPTAPPVAAVPEPGTWAMLLAGFFAIGVAGRRRALPRMLQPA